MLCSLSVIQNETQVNKVAILKTTPFTKLHAKNQPIYLCHQFEEAVLARSPEVASVAAFVVDVAFAAFAAFAAVA